MTSCKKTMSFEECELAILRQAVDKADVIEGEQMLKDPQVRKIIDIVENFLRVRKRVCYGGTAINALLPPQDQFYDMNVELPDYDFSLQIHLKTLRIWLIFIIVKDLKK